MPSHDFTGRLAVDDEFYNARLNVNEDEKQIPEETTTKNQYPTSAAEAADTSLDDRERVATRKSTRTIKNKKNYEINDVITKLVEFKDVKKASIAANGSKRKKLSIKPC
ncbi:hypothetical protein LEN26_013595 [Aphanomyces euteiches]|nr:hypothetical protein LEN26_013595 [Aphanomyces euteiches]